MAPINVDRLIEAVRAVTQILAPEYAPAIAAGEAIYALARDIYPTLTETDQERLAAALPELLERMNRNVDQAIADLRGS